MWHIEWYTDSKGRTPADEDLRAIRKGAGPQAVKKILRSVDLLADMGFAAPAELVKKVRGDLWELRATFRKNPYRILFYNPEGQTLVLLHLFHKKTDAILQSDIDKAQNRMADDRERRSGR